MISSPNMVALKYSDVCLIPGRCRVKSRKDIDTTVVLGKHTFKVPIIPANMVCTINENLAHSLAQNGYFYIYHRFSDTLTFCKNTKDKNLLLSISVGVGDKDYKLIDQLKFENIEPDYITIDIAHGYAESVLMMISKIKSTFSNTFVIAGNVATADGVTYLSKGGADAVKVGIGQGKACITKLKTGFTIPMFTCIQKCCNVKSVPIIADGGIEHNGDIAKAMVAGATMVMAGGIFAQLIDSPAYRTIDGDVHYFGSASAQNKLYTGLKRKNIEGVTVSIPAEKMSYLEKLEEIEEDLQSAVSYSGYSDMKDLVWTNWATQFN